MKQFSIVIYLMLSSVFINAQAWIKTDDATVFKYITKNEQGRQVKPNMILLADLFGTAIKANGTGDTVIFNSVSNDKPFYIPTEQPGLQKVFYQLHQGDSVIIKIIADSFYSKTFNSPLPSYIAKGSVVNLYFHVQEALTKEEIEQKAKEQNSVAIKNDSFLVLKYITKNKGFKKLASGLFFKKLVANSKGMPTQNGAMLSVNYKGWLIDGDVFDENKNAPPFKFVLGMKQVIAGWEQGLKQMKKGETYQLVIPWYLAYGSQGNGPIPPFTSIVFNIQLIEIH